MKTVLLSVLILSVSCATVGLSGPGVTVGPEEGVGVEVMVSGATDLSEDFLELEEIFGTEALKWVRDRNQESEARLGRDTLFNELKSEILQIIQAKDRIPGISIRTDGEKSTVFNFWQGEANPKGIYRSQSLQDFKNGKETWETVFDVDKIAKLEKEDWVFKGLECAPINRDRCLIYLSRGGGDAVVAREFHLGRKKFVKGGVFFPEAKMNLDWRDDESIWVGLPSGPGTVSKSGYAITVKLHKLGTDLTKSPVILKGEETDVGLWAHTFRSNNVTVDVVSRYITSHEGEYFVPTSDGSWKMLPLPREADLVGLSHAMMLFKVKKDATVFETPVKAGVVYAFDIKRWQESPSAKLPIEKVFEPTVTQSFQSISSTKTMTLISYLDRVRGRLAKLIRTNDKTKSDVGSWKLESLKLPGTNGVVSMGFVDSDEEVFTIYYNDFLSPNEMYMGDGRGEIQKLRATPKRFDASGMKVESHEATSPDGTRIPYFLVLPKNVDRKSKQTPTLISAYGGFEIPSVPQYLSAQGKVWVERGGAYVLANIRGGGEFGPKWHRAALKEKRQNAFDDLFAVAEDVIKSGLTAPRHLGFRGGSNGGLLAGVALTQRPDLFNAILCQVPLLDMLRFHKLLAGASWVGEYGDPEIPSERLYLSKYSPFQNLKSGVKYPEPFFTTSTRDDRVHPGHARKMVARMIEMKLPVLYYENIEGGHAGAATLESKAALLAKEYRYLWDRLGPEISKVKHR